MLSNITVTDIKEIVMVSSPKGRTAKMENRKNFGLSFCIEGQITYTCKGKKTVSDKAHAVLLPQGQTYTIYGDKTGSFPVINFTCTDKLCDDIISIPVENTEAYIKDFEKLRSLSLFEGNRAEMMSVFYHIIQRLSAQNSFCNAIVPAIKYIESNYQNFNLTNAELALKCNVSEVYFRRMFAKHYNTTPRRFLIDTRINKAKQLLSEGKLKINAVATQCGFSNQYHFCRVFKEKTGLTPTEYMKQHIIYKI